MKKDFNKQDFYDLLEPNGECLEWTLSCNRGGYGKTMAYGTTMRTHRLALMLEGVDITDKVVLHTCDNPKCCNPAHLRVGTHRDNINDKLNKNRQANGEKINHAKLTETDVLKIRDMFSKGKSQLSIAEYFGITKRSVCYIINRKTWKHI